MTLGVNDDSHRSRNTRTDSPDTRVTVARDDHSLGAGRIRPNAIRETIRPELFHLVVQERSGDGHLSIRAVRANRIRKDGRDGNKAANKNSGGYQNFN
jgi:hypothetical protein